MALTSLSCDGETTTINIKTYDDIFTLTLITKNHSKNVNVQILGWNHYSQTLFFLIDAKRYKAHITTSNETTQVTFFPASTFLLRLERARTVQPQTGSEQKQPAILRSPLAGIIIKQYASIDQAIKKDQPLVVIESMKMENEIRAEADTFIKTIQINEGDVVQANQVLMTFEDKNRSSNKEAE